MRGWTGCGSEIIRGGRSDDGIVALAMAGGRWMAVPAAEFDFRIV
jgi:hypothetical protein